MTIYKETRTEILRLYHAEKWRIGMIARHFSVHYTTVDRVLTDDGVPLQYRRRRRSKLDPFLPFIRQTLAVWPKLPASRLYEMVRERGYCLQNRTTFSLLPDCLAARLRESGVRSDAPLSAKNQAALR